MANLTITLDDALLRRARIRAAQEQVESVRSLSSVRQPRAALVAGPAGTGTTCMNGRVFLDTNVLVYLFDRDAPAKQRKARAILETEGPEGRIVVST